MQSQDPVELRVLDLNCWALRFLSKKRKERMALIGQLVIKEGYDIVLLQEVWSDVDYAEMRCCFSKVLRHAHHFKSGVIGSGLCIFSRFPIIDCLQHQFSLNGYPYMMNHGDWFCGKAVGMVKLQAYGYLCHVYITHLHAEYSRENDSYKSHRILQSWELAQFIRHTSVGSDIVLLAGDLNMHPEDLGLRLVREWTELKDAYTECAKYEGPPDGCTLLPCNPYTDPHELRNFPRGIRIDYVMYQSASGVSVTCQLVTTGCKSAGDNIPFSDHEIVTATFRLQRVKEPQHQNIRDSAALGVSPILTECCAELYKGVHSSYRRCSISWFITMMLLLFLTMQCFSFVLSMLGFPSTPFPPVLLTLILLMFSSISLLLHKTEHRQLQSVAEQIGLVQHGLQEKLGPA
ncbi:sphingomyelin phosphodiesterase 2 [Pelodytes ibericus]